MPAPPPHETKEEREYRAELIQTIQSDWEAACAFVRAHPQGSLDAQTIFESMQRQRAADTIATSIDDWVEYQQERDQGLFGGGDEDDDDGDVPIAPPPRSPPPASLVPKIMAEKPKLVLTSPK